MKKIGIIGTKRRNTLTAFKKVYRAFSRVYEEGDWIVSGGCRQGGDSFAEDISRQDGIPILIFPPDWKKKGKAAGFIRNTRIAEHSDVLIACVAKDRKGGTEDTIEKFEKLKDKSATIVS